MYDKEILLGKAKHKLGVNEDNFIDVELSSSVRELGITEESYAVDEYKQYFDEKDASQNYRLAFTITPYCTNVLFNVISEVVYKEGSDDCVFFSNDSGEGTEVSDLTDYDGLRRYFKYKGINNNKILRRNLISDTGFSLKDGAELKYHPGYDLFNNHYFRKLGFIIVNRLRLQTSDSINFNTIRDVFRDNNGDIIKTTPLISNGSSNLCDEKNASLYKKATLLSYYESIEENLSEENGWFGFVNKSTIPVKNYPVKNIDEEETVLVRSSATRSLVNDEYDDGNGGVSEGGNSGGGSGGGNSGNGNQGSDSGSGHQGGSESEDNNGSSNNTADEYGNDTTWYTINKCMNDCEAGDFVDMYPDRTLFSFVPKYNDYRKRVEANWDYCITYPSSSSKNNYIIQGENGVNGIFAVKKTQILSLNDFPAETTFKTAINHNLSNGDYVTIIFILLDGTSKIRRNVRVVSVGVDGEDKGHYFSIKTYQILNELFNANNTYITFKEIRIRKVENGVECEYYLRKFSKIETYNSQLNKLAFSQNAYSDPVAQIVFTDDVKTNELRDNLNRPISELYLTIVKRNKGYNKWYDGDYGNEEIEYSHCFGEITSGFDLPEDDEFKEYNVHRIHNCPDVNEIEGSPKKLESGITIDKTEFYGDIVEFSSSSLKETVLAPVYHRFNTSQREADNEDFEDFVYDEIDKDVYDYIPTSDTDKNSCSFSEISIKQETKVDKINVIPEGYYYKPHYLVKVREFAEEVNEGYHIEVGYNDYSVNGNVLTLELDKNYYFQPNDVTYLYKKNTSGFYELYSSGVCTYVSTVDYKTVEISFNKQVGLLDNSKIFRHNTEMPEYAIDLEDGSGKYIWREMLSFSEIPATDELYNTQFTNGAHYHHKNISFYLKRQDPDGIYGIGSEPQKVKDIFLIESEKKDVSNVTYKEITNNVEC